MLSLQILDIVNTSLYLGSVYGSIVYYHIQNMHVKYIVWTSSTTLDYLIVLI